MAILKCVNLGNNSDNPELIRNLIHYILKPSKQVRYWGGCNFLVTNEENVIQQFYVVRKIHHHEGDIQARHFVLSFASESDDVNAYQAYRIAHEICVFFQNEYQVAFAVHENTENIHIHFVINTTNLLTGRSLNLSNWLLERLYDNVEMVLKIPALWHGKNKVYLLPREDMFY